ncbi:MAG: lipocalin family protein [Pyrinomonadaceae bacterium]
MQFDDLYTSFFRNAERTASSFFDAIADTFAGEPDHLRDGTEFEPVVLPRDLAAHSNVQTEWWYYTGHGRGDRGLDFGFELVFFKRRTDLDRFSIVPLRLIGNPYYFAHFAVTDKSSGKFRYAHRKSSNGLLDLRAAAGRTHYYLSLGDWSAREAGGSHILRASLDGSSAFEASLTPKKPPVLNGASGVSFKDEGQASRYFSYTRMEMEGDITLNGRLEHFRGEAWMDREFGTWSPTENQKGWDWFSIQLDDNSELMLYQIRDSHGLPTGYSMGSFNDSDESVEKINPEDFEIEVTGTWTSPRSAAEYPSGWRINVPALSLELEVEPVLEDQELDTRGTTMIVYWEGACRVKGIKRGEPVNGNAYVELVGYDRTHEAPDLSRFLLGEQLARFGF